MKKIYSFMLLAAAMLLSVNANAVTQQVTTQAELQAAFNDQSVDVIEVNTATLNIASSVTIDLDRDVVLDLKGNTIAFSETTAKDMFLLYHGNLTVRNGVIQHNTSTTKNPLIFKVFGTAEPVLAGNFSHLTLEESVSLYVSGGVKGYGVSVNERAAYGSYLSTKIDGSKGLANGVRVDIYGYIEMMSGAGYCVKVNGLIEYAPKYFSTLGVENTDENVDLWVNCAPHIYLHSSSKLVAFAESNGVGAIYAAGFGVWDIRGEAEGACALAVKAGQITVTDAVLESTSPSYQSPLGTTSGIDAAGSAILIESNAAYPGQAQVTIAGDTRVEAKAGFAIQEAITTSDNTKVSAIDIEGGSFIGGNNPNAGCITISQGTFENPTTTLTIGGGTYQASNSTQEQATDALLTAIISGSNTYTTKIETGSTQGTGNAIIITSGTTPAPVEEPASFDIDDLYAKHSDSENPEDWNSIDLSEIPANTTFELTESKGNLTLGDVRMNGNNLTIIVNDGVTFTVNQLIMNNKARIIVKAGGKLIVVGNQGIVAQSFDNIKLEAQEGKSATFLIHPNVTSNKHPKATVEFVSKAFRVSSSNLLWQRFGVPSYRALDTIICQNPSLTTFVSIFDQSIGEEGDWRDLGKVGEFSMKDMNQPFVCYDMLSNSQAGGTKYTMTAELVGNGNAEINTNIEWPTCANSYLADIDLEKFYEALGDNMTKAIYVYTMQGNTNYYTWEPYDKMIAMVYPERGILPSMQGFILHRRTDEKTPAILSYEEAVYNPALGINAAPARRANNNDMTLAQIRMTGNEASDNIIVAQSDAFSAEFDNGYEAEKHMGSDLNLYVTDEAKMAHFATDELNNTYVGYSCAKAGVYTLSFENVRGQELTLVDLTNGVRTAMTNGATYTFTAAANETNDYRFQIVEAAKMPTDVEAIEAAPAKKAGIYTLQGQYLGNASKWNTLPAGIYVVDGVKKVK